MFRWIDELRSIRVGLQARKERKHKADHLSLSHHPQRLATYGPLLLLVVHLLLTFVIALIATPSPKTANPAVGEDGEDRAREENQSARGFGDARAHNDGEGVKMAELQSRGVESSSLPSYSSSCSSASEPPLEGKDGDR